MCEKNILSKYLSQQKLICEAQSKALLCVDEKAISKRSIINANFYHLVKRNFFDSDSDLTYSITVETIKIRAPNVSLLLSKC